MEKGDKILGKDLKPGMIVKPFYRLVISIDLEGSEKFFDGDPNIHMFDLNDSYWGPCCGTLDPEEEFEIVASPNTQEYRDIIDRVKKDLHSKINETLDDIDVLNNITREMYNDK